MKEPRKRLEGRVEGDKPLVYVRYLDHVLYKDMAPSRVGPVARETVGWLMYEDDEAVWIVWDRSLAKDMHGRPDPSSSLVILRRCIIEMRRIG